MNAQNINKKHPLTKETPLHDAVANGDLAQIRKIVALGANTKEKTLLRAAFFSDRVPVIREVMRLQKLTKLPNPNQYLHQEVRKHNRSIVKFLIQQGADINHLEDGATVLHTMLYHDLLPNAIPMIKLLLQLGIDVNIKDRYGDVPLQMASFYCNEAVIKLLLQKNADVNSKNKNGVNPLHQVVRDILEPRTNRKKCLNVIRLLMKHGAKPDERDKKALDKLKN